MPTLNLPFTPFYLAKPTAEERAAVEASTATLPFTFPHVGVTQAAPPLPPAVAVEGWTIDHAKVQVGKGRAAYRKAQRLLQQWRHFDLGWASTNAPPVKQGAGVVVTAKTLFAWSCSPLRVTYVEECGLRSGQQQPWSPPPQPRAKGTTQLCTTCGGRGGGSDASSSSAGSSGAGGIAKATAAAVAALPSAWRGFGRRVQPEPAAAAAAVAARPPRGRRYAYAHTTLAGHTIRGEERFAVAWNHEDDSVWYEIYTLSRPGSWVTAATHLLLRAYQRKFAADSMAAMQREMLRP